MEEWKREVIGGKSFWRTRRLDWAFSCAIEGLGGILAGGGVLEGGVGSLVIVGGRGEGFALSRSIAAALEMSGVSA